MEIIENREYGFYFEKENAESLVYQIENIINIYNQDEFKLKVANTYIMVSKETEIRDIKIYLE
jgi:hypothetical protein